MSSTLIANDVWKHLTRAARSSKRPGLVAVAYFGKGAAKLLPLRAVSRLVVDASEAAVKSGQTCPAELVRLYKKGVHISSAKNLHAKVFVFGSTAFVGSANVSSHSATSLIETVVAITDRKLVAAAREFVRQLCLQELGPEELKRLQKMYRPPRFAGGKRAGRKPPKPGVLVDLPPLSIVQLSLVDPPRGSERAEKAGRKQARKRMESPGRHSLQYFHLSGRCPYCRGSMLVQVLSERTGRRMVSPPGTVVSTRKWRRKNKSCTFVYVELPKRRRIKLEKLAERLGRGTKKMLGKGGRVNRDFAQRLLTAWAEK